MNKQVFSGLAIVSLLLLLLPALFSCEEEMPFGIVIEPGKEAIAVGSDGEIATLQISASGEWKAVPGHDWLTISPASGVKGTHSLTLQAVANPTTDNRETTVTIITGSKESIVTVTQEARKDLQTDTDKATVPYTAGSCQFTASSNIAYTATSNADWLQITDTKALSEKTLTVAYSENTSYDQRVGTITLSDDADTLPGRTFTVTQGGRGALYFVLKTDEVPAYATAYTVVLMKNTPASGIALLEEVPWISIPVTRAAPTEERVTLRITPNEQLATREARLILSDNSTGTLLSDTFTLVQAAALPCISPSKERYPVTAAGKTIVVDVKANLPFAVDVPAEASAWLTGPSGQQAAGQLPFVVAPNTSAKERMATVTLRTPQGTVSAFDTTFVVVQEAADITDVDRIPTLYNLLDMATTVETDPINLGAFTATVVDASTQATASWVRDIFANGGKLRFTVDDNPAARHRTATIHLTFGDGRSAAICVNQSGTAAAYIEVREAGTLPRFIHRSTPDKYKSVELSGTLNSVDIVALNDETLRIEKLNMKALTNATLPVKAFKGNRYLQSIVLPAVLTTVGDEAFAGCPKLGEIEFPETLAEIGERAFVGAFSAGVLRTLDLSQATGLKIIRSGAFEGCSVLKELQLPIGLETIESRAFKDCYGLSNSSMSLPEGLTGIGEEAFYNCSGLTGTLRLPETLVSLDERSFMKCSGLSSFVLKSTQIGQIKEEAFRECSNIKGTINLPEGVRIVARSAFEGTGMTEMNLPASLLEIGDRAFFNCLHLIKVALAANVPPVLGNNPADTFGGRYNIPAEGTELRTLIVPAASLAAYQSSADWLLAVPRAPATGIIAWIIKHQ